MIKRGADILTLSIGSKSPYTKEMPLSERKSLRQSINDFTASETLRVSIDKKMSKRVSSQLVKPTPFDERYEKALNEEGFISHRAQKGGTVQQSQRKKSTKIDLHQITNSNRKDAIGNMITKGKNKKQRVTFLDEIGSKKRTQIEKLFIETIDIQSFKKYNEDTSTSNSVKKKKGSCSCAIF